MGSDAGDGAGRLPTQDGEVTGADACSLQDVCFGRKAARQVQGQRLMLLEGGGRWPELRGLVPLMPAPLPWNVGMDP